MSARTLRILPFPTDPLKVFLDHVRTCLCRKRCHQPRHPPEIDLRTLAPRDRHTVVFSRTDALPLGQSLQLISDHAPQPLRRQLDDRAFGQFDWAALESGPIAWRVQITRVAAKPDQAAAGSCCSGGACCG